MNIVTWGCNNPFILNEDKLHKLAIMYWEIPGELEIDDLTKEDKLGIQMYIDMMDSNYSDYILRNELQE